MRDLSQQDHCDLGIVDDDQTPDMRKAPVAPEAFRNDHHAVTTTTKEI
ncbi:hypothetical protein [Mycolicibacterium mengxianglii]|nr:hypothetical protein [Mycolicibacterium mengxianglii]